MFFIKQFPDTDTYLEVSILEKKFPLHYRKVYVFIKQIPYTDTYLEVSF